MPSAATFWRWHFESVSIQEELAAARALGVEALLDEAREIADGNDVDIAGAKPGAEFAAAMTKADVKRAKLRVDTRIKMAQMLAPRKYGPKLDVTTDGGRLGNEAPADTAAKVVTILDAVAKRVGSTSPDIPVDLDPRTLDLLG